MGHEYCDYVPFKTGDFQLLPWSAAFLTFEFVQLWGQVKFFDSKWGAVTNGKKICAYVKTGRNELTFSTVQDWDQDDVLQALAGLTFASIDVKDLPDGTLLALLCPPEDRDFDWPADGNVGAIQYGHQQAWVAGAQLPDLAPPQYAHFYAHPQQPIPQIPVGAAAIAPPIVPGIIHPRAPGPQQAHAYQYQYQQQGQQYPQQYVQQPQGHGHYPQQQQDAGHRPQEPPARAGGHHPPGYPAQGRGARR